MVSVSIIVVVAGAGVCVIVSIIVDATFGNVAVAADPPSTGTTEYVALLTNGSNHGASRWENGNGNDEPKQKSDDMAKSVWVEVSRRMMRRGDGFKMETQKDEGGGWRWQ